jgi:hypothetical protein
LPKSIGDIKYRRALATHNLAGTLDGLTLLDETVRTEEHDTDLASLEVHAHALDAGSEPGGLSIMGDVRSLLENFGDDVLDQLLGLDVGHTVHTSDTITIRLPVSRKIRLIGLKNIQAVTSAWFACANLVVSMFFRWERRWLMARAIIIETYPTDRTRPVSARLDSSWTPRIRCSRMEETSVGAALASA